ncbi:hypothetical protein GOP47_0028073 [Adiantum capillus-veneris]|nr:hypothetical protein GOP47_0028073 [Adiantum capillus-veneris]
MALSNDILQTLIDHPDTLLPSPVVSPYDELSGMLMDQPSPLMIFMLHLWFSRMHLLGALGPIAPHDRLVEPTLTLQHGLEHSPKCHFPSQPGYASLENISDHLRGLCVSLDCGPDDWMPLLDTCGNGAIRACGT